MEDDEYYVGVKIDNYDPSNKEDEKNTISNDNKEKELVMYNDITPSLNEVSNSSFKFKRITRNLRYYYLL